jgi:hypothetical protein
LLRQNEEIIFAHIPDAEGNNVELWEPNDIEYEKSGKQLDSEATK